MRHLAVLLLLCLGCNCKPERLVVARNPKCGQPCYEGNEAQAGKGICTMGQYQCPDTDSEPVCVGWVGTDGKELCNGLDNNCDGELDGFVETCMAACGWGTKTCHLGQWRGECNGPQARPEVCNGLDDDCDGQIDEILELPVTTCYTGSDSELTAPFGDCHPGTSKCEAGKLVCRNQKLPSAETCDNIDNNCNSQIDEGIGDCTNGSAVHDIHVQLDWSHSNDLDLHLLHPDAGTGNALTQWHRSPLDCFFANRTPEWDDPLNTQDNPTLDRDIVHGIGPENITMVRPIIGHKYTIGVFSYNWSAQPNVVNASIKLYCGGILITTQTHMFARDDEMWVVGTVEYINQSQCIFTYDGTALP